MLKALKDSGQIGNKVAVVNVGDDFGIELANIGRPLFKEAGFEIVAPRKRTARLRKIYSAPAASSILSVFDIHHAARFHAFVGDAAAGVLIIVYEAAETSWRLTGSDNGIGTREGQLDSDKPRQLPLRPRDSTIQPFRPEIGLAFAGYAPCMGLLAL